MSCFPGDTLGRVKPRYTPDAHRRSTSVRVVLNFALITLSFVAIGYCTFSVQVQSPDPNLLVQGSSRSILLANVPTIRRTVVPLRFDAVPRTQVIRIVGESNNRHELVEHFVGHPEPLSQLDVGLDAEIAVAGHAGRDIQHLLRQSV